jgi:hypothetical protein
MTPEIHACHRCGFVGREGALDGNGGHCPECGGPLLKVSLRYARKLVVGRRSADRRRDVEWARAEMGLDDAETAQL